MIAMMAAVTSPTMRTMPMTMPITIPIGTPAGILKRLDMLEVILHEFSNTNQPTQPQINMAGNVGPMFAGDRKV